MKDDITPHVISDEPEIMSSDDIIIGKRKLDEGNVDYNECTTPTNLIEPAEDDSRNIMTDEKAVDPKDDYSKPDDDATAMI